MLSLSLFMFDSPKPDYQRYMEGAVATYAKSNMPPFIARSALFGAELFRHKNLQKESVQLPLSLLLLTITTNVDLTFFWAHLASPHLT